MGFSLTIQEGKDLGRQYTFDQPEVSIGRTAENDVVLYDPGVSRKHATIRCEEGRFYIKDLGSANGTQVNGNPTAEDELVSGDSFAVGPVVFSFEAAQDDGATRILDASAFEPPPPPRKPARPAPEEIAETRRKTTALPARRGPVSLVKHHSPEKPVPASSAHGGTHKRPAPIAKAGKGPMALSASERARVLRENHGLAGRIKLFLLQKPPAVRYGLLGGVGVLGLVALLMVAKSLIPSGPALGGLVDYSDTSFPLVENQADKVFGYGADLGVDTPTKDELHLTFEHSETIPIVYYLHFESQGIEREDEVDISLNTIPIGKVTPGFGDYTKEQRLKLPRKHLKGGVENEILFDNTYNSKTNKGSEPWAISKVRLEMKPLPGCSPDGECEREAKKNYDLAEVLWQQRKIDAGNTYRAWTNLNKSLLFLEAVEPKPDLYNLVQTFLRDTEKELDNNCSKIMLTAKKFEELQDWERALKEYKNGLIWFPGEDHPCRARLQEAIDQFN